MKKRSVKISGHATSITLEEPFWEELQHCASEKGLSVNQLVSEIDKTRTQDMNLSSAVRIYLLQHLKEKVTE